MEDQKQQDLIARIQACHPEVTLEYALDRLSGLYQFQIRDEVREIKGFGEALEPLLALKKSYGEFIERLCFRESNAASSNGFAAYPDRAEAEERALSELIERDALILSWVSARSPYWMNATEISSVLSTEGKALYDLVEFQRTHGLRYEIGILAQTGEHLTLVAALREIDGKEILALDTICHRSIEIALTKSLQAILSLSFIAREKFKKGMIKLAPEQVQTPMDHLNYYLQHPAPAWFWRSSEEIAVFPSFQFYFESCRIPVVCALDFSVARACSSEAQPLFFGPSLKGKVNFERLQAVFGIDTIINSHPHPLA